jgi:probable rRNA maturation factor
MMKQTNKQPRITVTGGDGKSSRIRAERLEIDFGGGRRLSLSFPESGWSDLEIEADVSGDETAVPIINVQPGACNVVNLRVDVHHDLLPVETADLPGTPPMLNLAVQKALEGADRLNAPKKHQVRRWAQAALLRDVEATVRLVGEEEGRRLNKNYRGKDCATNVLTFFYDNEPGDDAPLRGDLVLCVPVVTREANAQGKPLDAHFAHLVVHGMLHLQGLDHKAKDATEDMEARERDILRSLGYADPYA